MYYGCKKEVKDIRDYKMTVGVTSVSTLPEKFYISMPRVKDQGIVNSCVAHSLSTYLEKVYKDLGLSFSTGFIYGYRPKGYNQEEGMYPREALKTLQKIGDVEETRFSHNKEMPQIKKLVDENINSLLPLAEIYRIDSYARIYTEEQIKKCIFNGVPVPVSIPVYNDLALDDNNIVKMPEGKLNGYHMIILYGWNKNGYLFQNSWGNYWGTNGRAVLPYKYEIDSAWAISTDTNNVETYQTIWQKLYNFILKFFKKLKF